MSRKFEKKYIYSIKKGRMKRLDTEQVLAVVRASDFHYDVHGSCNDPHVQNLHL
jgi:hypothetical protein